jgi:uncharacterized protein YndB with AHSA1/START domain
VTEYEYTTYVRATPDDVWRALTDPAMTSRYWSGLTFRTDWQPGSTMAWEFPAITVVDDGQSVVECDAPRRLVYTWHTFSEEWGRAHDIPADVVAAFAAEPRSVAHFEIESGADGTRLTVRHAGFTPDSPVLAAVKDGWPGVLSSLKSLLETGRALGSDDQSEARG